MKKILAVLMAVCMIAGLGVTGYADAAAFPWGDLDVTNVIIADGLATVPAEPFAGMTGVVSVVLPASVRTVEDQAFAYSQIPALLLNDGLETIGLEAFRHCTSLIRPKVPDSVTSDLSEVFDPPQE